MASATGQQYTANSSRPSTDPWVLRLPGRCPRFTKCVRSCRYDWIQDSAVPDTPNSVCSRFVSVEWQTVSKTAERWRPINNVTSLLSAAMWTLSRTWSSAVTCYVYDNIRKLLNRILCTADSVSVEFQHCLMWECCPVSFMELPSRFSKRWRRCFCSDEIG